MPSALSGLSVSQCVHGSLLLLALLLLIVCYRLYQGYLQEYSLEQQLEELCN